MFELMDMNIYELIRGRRHYLPEPRVKLYMYQLIKAMDHMHRNGIFHRDVKPENILISDELLKVADFGSCRGIYSKQPYTEYISTRWYRAPECLLTDGYYGHVRAALTRRFADPARWPCARVRLPLTRRLPLTTPRRWPLLGTRWTCGG